VFGSHELLERKLRKHGKASLSTVLSCDRRYSMRENVASGVGTPKSLCKLKLRVEPDGDSAFEATTDSWLIGTEGAYEGMVVPVLYDPSDRAKVVVDHSEEAWKAADEANMRARFTARAAARGDDPARTAAMLKIRAAAVGDPTGFRRLMQEQGAAAFGLSVGASPARDPLDALAKLGALHDRGVLTDVEFETQKRKLLGE